MLTHLADVTLKSGEAMQVLKTTAPEPAWVDRIIPFLIHKGAEWLDAMRQAYTDGIDGLLMNDYLGVLASGEVVGNITTVESLGCGILQHVFTPERHRRQGIATSIMESLCRDFATRDGRALYLGTGYDTHPYHIYASFGFVGRGDSGKMTWLRDPVFLSSWFAPGAVTVRATEWADWPRLEALYATSGQWQLKCQLQNYYGHAGYESGYIDLRRRMTEGTVSSVRVMESTAGAVVGHALLAPQSEWGGRSLQLDFLVHANFYAHIGDLLDTLDIPTDTRVVCYCDENAKARMVALEQLGFEWEGTLRKQIQDENHQPLDVMVFARV